MPACLVPKTPGPIPAFHDVLKSARFILTRTMHDGRTLLLREEDGAKCGRRIRVIDSFQLAHSFSHRLQASTISISLKGGFLLGEGNFRGVAGARPERAMDGGVR